MNHLEVFLSELDLSEMEYIGYSVVFTTIVGLTRYFERVKKI